MGDSGAPIPLAKAFRVLQRAAEFDVRDQSLSIDELRRMAADVRIGRESIDAAINEVLATQGQRSSEAPMVDLRSILVSCGVGILMGFATTLPPAFALPGIVVAVLYLAVCAVTCLQTRAVLRFQVLNFALWVAGALTALLNKNNVPQDVALATFLNWGISAIVGGLLIAFGRRKGSAGQ